MIVTEFENRMSYLCTTDGGKNTNTVTIYTSSQQFDPINIGIVMKRLHDSGHGGVIVLLPLNCRSRLASRRVTLATKGTQEGNFAQK